MAVVPTRATPEIQTDRAPGEFRLEVLDGWRGISILMVLACHMLPLTFGPIRGNATFAVGGMALFFTLSGFLITTTLFRNRHLPSFLVRRLFRIVPLAALATLVMVPLGMMPRPNVPAHLFFYSNYAQDSILPHTGHFWSLCVELHFYLAIALAVFVAGLRGVLLLPLLGLGITGLRIASGTHVNIMTHLRVDEILAGVTLALVWLGVLGSTGRAISRVLARVPVAVWMIVFLATCVPQGGPLAYLRPYGAAAVIGSTVVATGRGPGVLRSRALRYIAEISYALYIVHPLTMYGWMNEGGFVVKYSKRLLSFALTFGLAHLSTYFYERRWIEWGRQICRNLQRSEPTTAPAPVANPRPVEQRGI